MKDTREGTSTIPARNIMQEFQAFALPEFTARLDRRFQFLEQQFQGQSIPHIRRQFAAAAREVYQSILEDFSPTLSNTQPLHASVAIAEGTGVHLPDGRQDDMSEYLEPFLDPPFDFFNFDLPGTFGDTTGFNFDAL